MFLFAQQSIGSALSGFLSSYGVILVPVALGLVAIYFLLPRPTPTPRLFGAVAGALAVLVAGWALIGAEVMLAETLLFYAFAGLAVGFGGHMIAQSRPVHAALSFAMVVLSTCGLFLLQAAPFLMAATIIIYAGAIVVTFLFVIMLAQQAGLSDADARSREPFLATLAGFVLLGAILCVLQRSYAQPSTEAVDLSALSQAAVTVDSALKAKTVAEMQAVLTEDALKALQGLEEPLKRLPSVYKQTSLHTSQLQATVDLIEETWAERTHTKEQVIANLQPRLRALRKELDRAQEQVTRVLLARQGVLTAPADRAAAQFSGVPAHKLPPLDATGRARMPAENVAALGRSLFTDYLVPVEMAATLLLVATIGAIAIAIRRTEGLS